MKTKYVQDLIKKAKNDKESQFRLGLLYSCGGFGVTPDSTKAIKWYELSSGQGHEQAKYKLKWLLKQR